MSQRLAELKQIPIMDLAFHKVVSVDKNDSLQQVCDVLSDRRIKKVPVTESGQLVGVINRTDLLRSMINI